MSAFGRAAAFALAGANATMISKATAAMRRSTRISEAEGELGDDRAVVAREAVLAQHVAILRAQLRRTERALIAIAAEPMHERDAGAGFDERAVRAVVVLEIS